MIMQIKGEVFDQAYGFKPNNRYRRYIGRFELSENNDKYVIWNLKVDEHKRNKGYGTQMLTEFLSQFKSNKPLCLYVYKTNEIAIRLYEKVGFSIVGDYHGGSYAYEMRFNA